MSDAERALTALLDLMARLRDPQHGCPWDQKQTFATIAPYTIEEAYEVADAIERGEPDKIRDELGDLLFQVVIHSVLAREAGAFTIADVARGIHTKLVRRHPHVFGSVAVDGSGDVVRNWEQIKRDEKGSDSLVAGVTMSLPSLLLAPKLFRKAASIGLDPALHAEARAVSALGAVVQHSDDDALGELLGAVVALAWARGLDPEAALRSWARGYRDRFAAMERQAAADGIELVSAPPDVVAAAWERAGDG
jgi:MazG family protein